MNPTRIGHYEIRQRLGAGGMGEVFLARDTRLGRDVALKVLPDTFAGDAGRMSRFEREARVLASLNHPNIAALYGIEESGGRKALVMELVPGEDLSQRIARGVIPLEEAIRIAVQVARALEAAHQKGVIHRDLKPANVRVTDNGEVKVLDFGLAKSVEVGPASDADLSQSPTLTQQATLSGVILGTAAYMSPEQARGKVVDARSDIFSFGAVLFEMLSGEGAFGGSDTSEVIASIIKGEVRWDCLPPGVPQPVRRLIRRCLEGRIEERYHAIGDVRVDLAGFLAEPAALAAPVARAGPLRNPVALLTVVAIMGLVAGVVGTWMLRAPSARPGLPPAKFRVDAPGAVDPVLSPDGSLLAYIKEGEAWLRRMDSLEARRLDLPWEVSRVAWSHDSRTLVLVKGSNYQMGDLWRIPVEGGEPRPITRLPAKGFLYGVSARNDDEILLGMGDEGIYSVALRGGEPRLLLPAGEKEVLADPRILPNGRDMIFCEAARGRIESFDGRARRVVLEMAGDRISRPAYSWSGRILFSLLAGGKSHDGTWAVPFSAESLTTTGPAVRVLPQGDYSLSRNDTLAFLERTGAGSALVGLVWVDRRGEILRRVGDPVYCGAYARRAGEPLRLLGAPALSPDGRRVAMSGFADREAIARLAADIFVFDENTGARYPLRDDLGRDTYPFWRDGGRTVGFVTYAPGIREVRETAADGFGEAARIVRAPWATASRDGRYIVYAPTPRGGGLHYLEQASAEGQLFLEGESFSIGDLSPDNRFFAYSSASGIFLKRFPTGPALIAVTSGEGDWAPLWRPDGKELFFWREDTLMAVTIDSASDDPRAGKPHVLFSATENRLLTGSNYDVAIDGRFLMLQRTEQETKEAAPNPGIVIIQNWSAEFQPGASN